MDGKRKGICKNFGNCPNADNKVIIDVDLTADFVCPEEDCGRNLVPIERKVFAWKKLLVLAGILVVIFLTLLCSGSFKSCSSNGGGGGPDTVNFFSDKYLPILESILDTTLTSTQRIDMITGVHSKVFSGDVIVETVGNDQKTIVDHERSMNYVKRLAVSAYIKKLAPVQVKLDSSGRVTYLRVYEVRIP